MNYSKFAPQILLQLLFQHISFKGTLFKNVATRMHILKNSFVKQKLCSPEKQSRKGIFKRKQKAVTVYKIHDKKHAYKIQDLGLQYIDSTKNHGLISWATQ